MRRGHAEFQRKHMLFKINVISGHSIFDWNKKKIAYNEVKVEILIDWIVFKAVSAIFQPCNGGTGKMGI